MKTTQQNQNEGKLGNRTAHLTESSGKKWLLYLTDEKDPLIGFVHAATKEEALDRMAVFGKTLLAVPAVPPVVEPMTPERITCVKDESRGPALWRGPGPAKGPDRKLKCIVLVSRNWLKTNQRAMPISPTHPMGEGRGEGVLWYRDLAPPMLAVCKHLLDELSFATIPCPSGQDRSLFDC